MTQPIKQRNIVLCILFTFLTCGIYGLFWFVTMTNDLNRLSRNDGAISGGIALLLSLVTCGIYTFVWAYQMGERADACRKTNAATGVVCLILSLFGFGIVAYCLLQHAINQAAAEIQAEATELPVAELPADTTEE